MSDSGVSTGPRLGELNSSSRFTFLVSVEGALLPGPCWVSWLGSYSSKNPASSRSLLVSSISSVGRLSSGATEGREVAFASLVCGRRVDDERMSCSCICVFSHFSEWISFISFLTTPGSTLSPKAGEPPAAAGSLRSLIRNLREPAVSFKLSSAELQATLPLRYLVSEAEISPPPTVVVGNSEEVAAVWWSVKLSSESRPGRALSEVSL